MLDHIYYILNYILFLIYKYKRYNQQSAQEIQSAPDDVKTKSSFFLLLWILLLFFRSYLKNPVKYC